MQEFINIEFLNNTILKYLIFFGCFIVGILVICVIKHIVLKRLLKLAEKTDKMAYDAFIKGIKRYFIPLLYFADFYLSIKILYINATLQKIIDVVTLAFVMFFAAVFVSEILIFIVRKYWSKKYGKEDKAAIKWTQFIIKVIVWVAALMLFLDNIGVQITALVAGLGVGGIAVAFALQAILEDLFSFVTIFLDKPFEIDDFIVVDDLMGNVEHIGIKTTRVRSLRGEQLVFSNKDLTNSRVQNFKKMEKRRVLFKFGVTYDTPLEKLKEIPELIKNIITNVDYCEFSRTHFYEYADFSLNFENVYYVLNQDYDIYMDVQQEINFRIKEEFDKRNIEFAFPTQTLYVKNS
ncbi:MAG: mechanosensitive ion channel family protein [Eubacteriales bacterium]